MLKALTNSSDNSGCKYNSIWPVPVVEGLAASYGDSLACSIRHHLSTKKVELMNFNLGTENSWNDWMLNKWMLFGSNRVCPGQDKGRQEVVSRVSSISSATSFLMIHWWYLQWHWWAETTLGHPDELPLTWGLFKFQPLLILIGKQEGKCHIHKQPLHNCKMMHALEKSSRLLFS